MMAASLCPYGHGDLPCFLDLPSVRNLFGEGLSLRSQLRDGFQDLLPLHNMVISALEVHIPAGSVDAGSLQDRYRRPKYQRERNA